VTEVLALDEMLGMLRGFDPIRRVLLATPGTLQGTLAAYFGEPVEVEVLSQSQEGATFDRRVELVLREARTVVCRAHSRGVVSDDDILKLVMEQRIGLGRIAQLLRRDTFFRLESVSEADGAFMRIYRLEGEGFSYHIREEFPCELYPADHRRGRKVDE
jgi:hypothetical protein